MIRRRSFALGAAATVAAPGLLAQTQFPPVVRIVVGFPPGGGTDVLARVLAPKLQDMWKNSVVVESKAGAAGVVAADYVSKQAADGTTLLMAHINSHAIAPALNAKLTYNPETDFSPICLVGVTPNLLIGNPSQPSRTLQELVAECKAKVGQVTFGSSGPASAQHLALELFKYRAKVFALHIPYRGSGPLLTDLIGGQVQYSFETMTAATPHVKAGKVIAIAQTRPQRSKAYPDLPTVAESGFPDFDATTWYGLVGPKGLPAAMVRRMNEDVNKAMALPDVVERLNGVGAEDGGGSPARFTQFMQAERKKYAALVKDANIKIDS